MFLIYLINAFVFTIYFLYRYYKMSEFVGFKELDRIYETRLVLKTGKTIQQYCDTNTIEVNDMNEYYTPKSMIRMAIQDLKLLEVDKKYKVWEAFGDCNNKLIGAYTYLRELQNNEVITSDGDFFLDSKIKQKDNFIFTNSPFSSGKDRMNMKEQILRHCLYYRKPFILLLPSTTSSTRFYAEIQDQLHQKIKEIRIVGRTNFMGHLSNGVWSDKKQIKSECSYYIWGMDKINPNIKKMFKYGKKVHTIYHNKLQRIEYKNKMRKMRIEREEIILDFKRRNKRPLKKQQEEFKRLLIEDTNEKYNTRQQLENELQKLWQYSLYYGNKWDKLYQEKRKEFFEKY